MGFFGKVGGGFGWFGKKLLWIVNRNETLFAASFIPIPALDKAILLVRALDKKNASGAAKFLLAYEKLVPILAEYGIENKAEINFILELAVQIMKKRARVVEVEEA